MEFEVGTKILFQATYYDTVVGYAIVLRAFDSAALEAPMRAEKLDPFYTGHVMYYLIKYGYIKPIEPDYTSWNPEDPGLLYTDDDLIY